MDNILHVVSDGHRKKGLLVLLKVHPALNAVFKNEIEGLWRVGGKGTGGGCLIMPFHFQVQMVKGEKEWR